MQYLFKKSLIFVVLTVFIVPNYVQSAEIEETVLGMNVSGNKEAPNLLYIIPWKEIDNDANPPEIYRLMDEVYSTVDPDVFEKEVAFFDELTSKEVASSEQSED